MSLTPNEAAAALADVERTQRRSQSAFNYLLSWPHLVLWGVVWIVGYGGSYLHPAWAQYWFPLALIGSAGSFWIGIRSNPKPRASFDWRMVATFVTVFVFIGAMFSILQPLRDAQVAAFFPLCVAFYYVILGIWSHATRMLLLGIAVAAATLGGYFGLPHIFNLWMAIVGGGGLILGGLWLRHG